MGDIIKTISKILGIVLLVAVLGAIIFNDYQQNQKINELISQNQNDDGGMTQIQVESIISMYLTKNGYVAGESDKYVEAETLETEISKVLNSKKDEIDDETYSKLENTLKEYIDEKLKETEENKEDEKKDEEKEKKETSSKTTSKKASSSKKQSSQSNQTQNPTQQNPTQQPSSGGGGSSDDAFVVDGDEEAVIN